MKKLMLAYGMNTNLIQMANRCPTAVSLGAAVLPNYKFEFKNFATVEKEQGQVVHGVLWEILESDEAALDMLEGFPLYYDKAEVKVVYNGGLVTAMTYYMRPEEVLGMPSKSYYNLIADGYDAHGISLDQLNDAMDRVHVNYRLTEDAFGCIM
jgi:gamma-glutamylcyclotransferase (GGCT)/AIG2-like uncharacterized protein YtfP